MHRYSAAEGPDRQVGWGAPCFFCWPNLTEIVQSMESGTESKGRVLFSITVVSYIFVNVIMHDHPGKTGGKDRGSLTGIGAPLQWGAGWTPHCIGVSSSFTSPDDPAERARVPGFLTAMTNLFVVAFRPRTEVLSAG